MPLKLLLLQPKGTSRNFTRSQSVYPPLGLCQIAAMFPKEEAFILDADGLNMNEDEVKDLILQKSPPVLGMTTNSFTIDMIEFWAKWAKGQGIVVIVGGPHSTIMPEDFFLHSPSTDFIIRGEAELVIRQVIHDIIEGKLPKYPGVCYRTSNSLSISDTIITIDDLTKIPFPVIDELPIMNYHCPDALRYPMTTMQISRGCPNACAFCSCSFVQGRKIRYFDTESILHQLEYMNKTLGIKEISFVDDGFSTNKKKALEICNGIIERNLDITWFCNARADCLSVELVKKMKQAGCHQVYLGFESGNDEILKSVNKNLNREKLINGAKLLKQYGIDISVGFIVGLPGETLETLNQSIDLALEVNPDRIQFTRFVSLPGSKLYEIYGPNSIGFHQKEDDQVGRWMKYAYEQYEHRRNTRCIQCR